MPELPEAETIGRALALALTGRRLERVEIFSSTLRTPLTPLTTAGLPGLRICSVHRRGRYLVAALSDGRGLLIHLGMSGVIRIEDDSIPRRKHEHVFIYLDNGMIFRFESVRRFARLEIHPLNADGLPECLASLGAEPLSRAFTPEYLYRASRGRRGALKPFLMNNAIVAGIGNIYATEILFAAQLDPRRAADSLTRKECGKIVKHARRILRAAIRLGGTTVSDFRHVDGSEGQFALRLAVYGKAGQPCPVCGEKLVCVKLGGRSSTYCPQCQK